MFLDFEDACFWCLSVMEEMDEEEGKRRAEHGIDIDFKTTLSRGWKGHICW